MHRKSPTVCGHCSLHHSFQNKFTSGGWTPRAVQESAVFWAISKSKESGGKGHLCRGFSTIPKEAVIVIILSSLSPVLESWGKHVPDFPGHYCIPGSGAEWKLGNWWTQVLVWHWPWSTSWPTVEYDVFCLFLFILMYPYGSGRTGSNHLLPNTSG